MTSKTKSIGELFSGVTRFEVPKHQRDYSWSATEVRELFADIETSQSKGADSYYIGMLVLVEPQGTGARYQILDGQQRLTTLTLLFAAARDWCKGNGLTVEAERIQKEFIGFADYGQAAHDPRIILNSTNRDVFEQHVVNDPTSTVGTADLEKTNALLLSAKSLCVDLLRDSLATIRRKTEQEQKLWALVKFLRDAVQATVVDVREPEDAYTIFEALNDRGLELSIFDLLKNHVYRELGAKNESLATHHWERLAVNLRERKADEFVRIFWMLRHGRIQKGTLFTRIREEYSGVSKAQVLIKEMVADSELYASIDSPDGDTWQAYGDALREDIRSIAILGGNQSRPVMLAALKSAWREADLKRLSNAMIALIVRHQIVGRERTGALEIFCADLSYEIFTKRISATESLNKIRLFYPDDTKFKADFAIFEETRAHRAKYFLTALNRTRWRKAHPNSAEEFEVIRDIDKVNIEHVFPKKYSSNASWAAIAKANPGLEAMVHRLGNQCLLAKGPNAKVGNKDLAMKKGVYDGSELPDTQSLARTPGWTPSDIANRQKELADLAVRIWKI
jgi:hypothetical protein